MPTNKERREVAARLRELDGWETETLSDTWYVEQLSKIVGYSDAGSMTERLADLIKPEPERTCHDVSFDPLREFVCSWCGCHIDVLGIESEPTMWLGGSPIEPSFCPNCGAKVVANE